MGLGATVKEEAGGALEVRRALGQLRAAHGAVGRDLAQKVVHERVRLRRIDFEVEVGVADDDLRRAGAELSHQVDVVEVRHRGAADEPRDLVDLVDEHHVKVLPVQVVQRLERADDGLTGGEVDTLSSIEADRRKAGLLQLVRQVGAIQDVGAEEQHAGGGLHGEDILLHELAEAERLSLATSGLDREDLAGGSRSLRLGRGQLVGADLGYERILHGDGRPVGAQRLQERERRRRLRQRARHRHQPRSLRRCC